jgi:protease-4
MPQKRSTLLLWIIGGGGVFIFFILCLIALASLFSDEESGFSFSSDQVAVLNLEGEISDSKGFIDELKDYGNRSGVRSVVIRINSPGGTVAASQEIFQAIKKFRSESNKKVVASMASVAASGGYYAACGADKIYANPGTVTGSIGVIAEWFNYGDLLKWAKVQSVVIKTGALKDAGSQTRPLTEEEKVYFQSLIGDMFGQFVSTVAASRKMKEEEVRKLADGRVFTGRQAKANRLVDELGSYQDALAEAARLGGGGADSLLRGSDRSESHIRFQYLWR